MVNRPITKKKFKTMAMLVATLMCIMLLGCIMLSGCTILPDCTMEAIETLENIETIEDIETIETFEDQVAEGVTKSVKHTLYVGLNDKDTYKQEVSDESAIQIVRDTSLKYLDGFTVYKSQGLYKDMIGQVVEENSLVIEVYDAAEDAIQNIMDELLVALNQESILIEKEDVNFDFYSGKGD